MKYTSNNLDKLLHLVTFSMTRFVWPADMLFDHVQMPPYDHPKDSHFTYLNLTKTHTYFAPLQSTHFCFKIRSFSLWKKCKDYWEISNKHLLLKLLDVRLLLLPALLYKRELFCGKPNKSLKERRMKGT